MTSWASPHTRGWTRVSSMVPPSVSGFPAHAGMDPVQAARAAARIRLPRTRGDGPGAAAGPGRSGWASPHTRGWTPAPAGGGRAGLGFPAHAGMDPSRRARRSARRWLPRTRGDGPVRDLRRAEPRRASPHTRGWTLNHGPRAQYPRGFPAHAGMDPPLVQCRRRIPGLPRTRGDGPGHQQDVIVLVAASPHTRGWTRRAVYHTKRWRGFPAHAGMDPRWWRPAPAPSWLPRTRGDGPPAALTGFDVDQASPHTRGWTRTTDGGERTEPGFPAHAGMDPRRCWRRSARYGLPRTRGDGPAASSAGFFLAAASPHTRGWTADTAGAVASRMGFPAHAGMDPARCGSRTRTRGLPRTRGDGPDQSHVVPSSAWASPHTRGWTRKWGFV